MSDVFTPFEKEIVKVGTSDHIPFNPMRIVGDLIVIQSAPKTAGNKADVLLKLKNTFAEPVQSARAICFLLDDQGRMVGQSTKWVVGQTHTSLEPHGETTYNFVITSSQPFTTTNLTAKVSFSRVVLDGGKLADAARDVRIEQQELDDKKCGLYRSK